MAITRKQLKGMGLTDEQVDSVIESHSETVSGLKDEIEKYKAKAEELDETKKELEQAKKDLEAGKNSGWKEKYESLKKEYDDYKSEQSAKESHEAKEKAYRGLLEKVGISEKRIGTVLKVSSVDDVELDDDGKIKGADDLEKSIKTEWADFITTKDKKGADVSNPPSNTGGTVETKDEILKIKDPVARQNAIAENLDLFQKKGD